MVTITMVPDRVLRTSGLQDAPVGPKVRVPTVAPRAELDRIRVHHVHELRVRRLQVRRAVYLRVEAGARRV